MHLVLDHEGDITRPEVVGGVAALVDGMGMSSGLAFAEVGWATLAFAAATGDDQWIHTDPDTEGPAYELRPADHLWGTQTLECQTVIREELGEPRARLAMIGPGGEKMIRFACVINDLKHAAGRTGLGAVMGSKNLKAIAVRGNRDLPVYDIKALMAEADVVLCLGTRLNPFSTLPGYGIDYWPKGAKIIQVEIEPTAIGRFFPVEVGLWSDAGAAARALRELITDETGLDRASVDLGAVEHAPGQSKVGQDDPDSSVPIG